MALEKCPTCHHRHLTCVCGECMGGLCHSRRPDPPELFKRIADVVREHQMRYRRNQGFYCTSLSCFWHGPDFGFPDHVAEEIGKLFIEEHGYLILPERPQEPGPDAWFPADNYATDHPVSHRRWSSEWEKP